MVVANVRMSCLHRGGSGCGGAEAATIGLVV